MEPKCATSVHLEEKADVNAVNAVVMAAVSVASVVVNAPQRR